MNEPGSAEWHLRMLRAWHMALLRFAVTLDNADRLSLLAVANEMDRLGQPNETRSDFGFFRGTSAELCAAIVARSDVAEEKLRQHLARIDDTRLRRALAAALEIDLRMPEQVKRRPKPDDALWKGLPSRGNIRA